jgi:hypothetical protein
MNDAEFIEASIPDKLRLAEHPDAELINRMIATALLAYRNSDSVWEKNKCKDINFALLKAYEEVFAPHIAKEDEDWNALKSKASEVDSLREIAARVPELEAKASTKAAWDTPDFWRDRAEALRARVETLRGDLSKADTISSPRGRAAWKDAIESDIAKMEREIAEAEASASA